MSIVSFCFIELRREVNVRPHPDMTTFSLGCDRSCGVGRHIGRMKSLYCTFDVSLTNPMSL